MPFNPNKPLAGDLLSQSQSDIEGNFQALGSMLDANSPTVKLTPLGVPLAAIPGQMQLYAVTDPTTGHPQIYIEREQGAIEQPTTINLTASNKTDAAGWTYLPSGMLLFWGSIAPGALSPVNVAFADGGFDNSCFSVVVTPTQGGTRNWCDANSITPVGFVFESFDGNQHPSIVSFNYIAIGY
jgi:hypothetical protein